MLWPLLIPFFTCKAECFLQKKCSQNECVPFSRAKPFISSWCNYPKNMVNIYIIIILPLMILIYWYYVFSPTQMSTGLLSVSGLQICPYGHMPVSHFFISVFPNLENLESSSIINIPLRTFFHKEKYYVSNTSLSDKKTCTTSKCKVFEPLQLWEGDMCSKLMVWWMCSLFWEDQINQRVLLDGKYGDNLHQRK